MDFEELMEALINPGPEGADPAIYDQLREAHITAVTGARDELEGATSELATMTSERDAAMAEVVNVKAMNFDKLMSQGAPASPDGDPDLKTKTLAEDESAGEKSTSDFFEKEDQ